MLVSLPILIVLRYIIYCWKNIDKHFLMQVQLCKSVAPIQQSFRSTFETLRIRLKLKLLQIAVLILNVILLLSVV